MFYTTQPGGFYGGGMGNEGAMRPGGLQNLAGNPFGADFVIQNQMRRPTGGPQLNPLQQPPARIFPKDQPGREGAIDIQFRQAMNIPGAPGNMAGMANPQFFYGPQYGQVPAGFQNKMVS